MPMIKNALASALRRNLYRDQDMNGMEIRLSKEVLKAAKQLDKQSDDT